MSYFAKMGDFAVYISLSLGLLVISDYYTFSRTIAVADSEMRKRVERSYEEFQQEKAMMELSQAEDEIEAEARAHQLAVHDWDGRLILARFRASENLLHAKPPMFF